MKDEIEKSLRQIGGDRLVGQWQATYDLTPVNRLPTAYLDKFALGYAVALGAIATSIDLVMDQAFRDEMAETHAKLSPEEQQELEKKTKARIDELMGWSDKGAKKEAKKEIRNILQEAGANVDENTPVPDVAMDYYQKWLNEKLGLKSPFMLSGTSHRILNHADAEKVIAMLMRGEVGIGDLVVKAYPALSEGVAREIFNLHIAADRHGPQSVPLKIMSWLWEQSVRSQNPGTVGAPNFLFDLLQKHAPNIDWKKWIEAFFGKDGVAQFVGKNKTGQPNEWPEGMSISDVMLRLYDNGIINERVFWTSNLGASVGGFKRRVIIAATMEAGVEVFALVEGLSSGFVTWDGGVQQFVSGYLEWRDQPKYLNMRTLAQATAAAGPAVRALWTGDAFSQNIPSIAMTMRHLWVSADVHRRHTDRLLAFSRNDCDDAIEEFEAATGVRINSPLALIEGGRSMVRLLDSRLSEAGCVSTRVRVLASRYPDKMEPIVARIEKLAEAAQGNDMMEEAVDDICVTWYLSDTTDDAEALNQLKADIARLEKKLG
jgi:hypothetical protein